MRLRLLPVEASIGLAVGVAEVEGCLSVVTGGMDGAGFVTGLALGLGLGLGAA